MLAQVLPVMVMGAFVPGLRRKYSILEYVSAIMLVLGLVTFTLADAQTSPTFSPIGLVMVIGALVLDSFVGNLQEAIFTLNPATTQARIQWPLRFMSSYYTYVKRHYLTTSWFYHGLSTDGDAVLFNISGTTIPYSSNAHHRGVFSCLVQLLSGGEHLSFCHFTVQVCSFNRFCMCCFCKQMLRSK